MRLVRRISGSGSASSNLTRAELAFAASGFGIAASHPSFSPCQDRRRGQRSRLAGSIKGARGECVNPPPVGVRRRMSLPIGVVDWNSAQ